MVKGGKKPSEIVVYTLRLREGLLRRIEREGRKRGRSINAQMIEMLESALEGEPQTLDKDEIVIAVKEALQPTIKEQVKSYVDEMYKQPNEDGEEK